MSKVKKPNWLASLLFDVERRAAARHPWEMSEYAQAEIARLRNRKATP